MRPIPQEKENEGNMDNIIDFSKAKLVTGGGKPPGDDWLSALKVDTTFICEVITDMGMSTAIQQEYIVVRQDKESTLLMANINEPAVLARVSPSRFCKHYRLVEILYTPEEEVPNGNY